MTTTAIATAARARDVTKIYGQGQAAITALDAVSLDIPAGSFSAVMGPSGSGKSTLMHCMAGLDSVTSGQLWIGEIEIGGMRDRQLTQLRRDRIGFVFQAFNLLPVLSAEANITLPLDIAGRRADQEWLATVIRTVGLLRGSVREFGQTVVMVTHDPVAASYADRVVFLADGQIAGELEQPSPESVLDAMKKLGE
ncbi:MAG TPA: ABC transporter ATP-binding protein [Streptosporangiaceae bacterium]|jgi:putative ABC transport system ATP-binding protein|nr:ABC transporter ATP-binding protein [Streptosporangiaceae bacterium]